LIIAEEIEANSEALATLILNKQHGFKVVAVKAEGGGNLRETMIDIATITGANLVSTDMGFLIENLKLDDLGSAKKVIVKKDCTIISGGNGDKESIKLRCEQLKTLISSSNSEKDIARLKIRLAKIDGGIAVLKVGGATDVEIKERIDRVDDALNATKAAVDEGITAGGGITLFYAASSLNDLYGSNQDQKVGIDIIANALKIPVMQIAENAGYDGAVVVSELNRMNSKEMGFNAQDLVYVNMFEAGIIDPTKVVRTALEDAASIASLVLTSECLITNEVENDKSK
jgi:chaperonin GroEL